MGDLHHEDHKHLLEHMNVNKEVATLDKDITLIKERLKDEKEERERCRQEEKADKTASQRLLMWAGGLIFSIVMASAGFGIQSNATIQVLQEKVKEQKTEIEKLTIYIQDVNASLSEKIDYHQEGHQ